MNPAEIRDRNLLPEGFLALPHVKQATGGQVFPRQHNDEITRQEHCDFKRFDVDCDLPGHLTPEFPPPIFPTVLLHLDLARTSHGELNGPPADVDGQAGIPWVWHRGAALGLRPACSVMCGTSHTAITF